ncbi:DUF2325 domain-containing protein [Beijerinckia sp. L45]|uniref:DUF2325 domain-containing protein n=1 Tax=Beijerinckia sp. L45 TaxID=1641855 RepID=UPI00131A82D0|nr:DUF2325 domain-containing protein [Beijerinckia sp. L45]
MSAQTVLNYKAPTDLGALLKRERAPAPLALADPKGERRTKIWDIAPVFHCSIVGTCLTAAELRQVFVRLREPDAKTASDHALHSRGVRAAGQHDLAGKQLHKTIDARHEIVIKRFAKATTPAEIRALWRHAFEQGAIPGAYWATLTHPASDRALLEDVFGEVHMLSHLVGSANRVDIARLTRLERELGEEAEKSARQEARLQAAAQDRLALLRRIEALEAERLQQAAQACAKTKTMDDTIEPASQLQRLDAEKARASALAERLHRVETQLRAAEQRATILSAQNDQLRSEVAAVEFSLNEACDPGEPSAVSRDLAGLTLLYVGGRPKVVDQLKAITAQRGGALLAHDGGVEDNTALLAGLISQADRTFFPVDCISHLAAGKVKKVCRDAGKPYIPLRSASLASFLAALHATAPGAAMRHSAP